MTLRCNYTAYMKDGVLCVLDDSYHKPAMSVTNDVEGLLVDLGQKGLLAGTPPLVYRDSQMHWDGIAYGEANAMWEFLEFVPIRTKLESVAIVMAKGMRASSRL